MKFKVSLIIFTIILNLFFIFLPGKASNEDVLEKAIKTDITNKYGFDKESDMLQKYYGDFDKDGKKDVLVVLRNKKKENTTTGADEQIRIFIYKPVNSDYKLVFHEEFPPSLSSPYHGEECERVRIVESSKRTFLGFIIPVKRGANCHTFKLLVYSYNADKQKYTQVFKEECSSLGYTFPYDLLSDSGNIWMTRLGFSGTSVCPKTFTEYFLWNGKTFVYDHKENSNP